MSLEFDRDNLISIFVAEASDGMAAIARALNPTDGAIPTPPQIQEHFITAHRIRGAAALYGYEGVAALSERLEAMCEPAVHIPDEAWPRVVGVMRETVQGIQALVSAIEAGRGEEQSTVDRCLALSEAWVSAEPISALIQARSVPVKEGADCSDSEQGVSGISVEYVVPPIDATELSYFLPQAEEYLSAIDGLLQVLRTNQDDADAAYRVCRAAETLKQAAYTVGFQVIGDIAHPMEACMTAIQERRIRVTDELLSRFARGGSLIRTLMKRERSTIEYMRQEVPKVLSLLHEMDGSQARVPSASHHSGPGGHPASVLAADPLELKTATPSALSDEYFLPRLDPDDLSYFVPEAQGYLETLEEDLLQLDQHPENKDLIQQLFRTAHTLKGSAYTVGFQVIGDLVHDVEDFIGAVRHGRLQVLPGHIDAIFRAIDVVRVLMQHDSDTVQSARKQFQFSRMELKRLELGEVLGMSETGRSADPRVLQAELQGRQGEGQAAGITHPEGKSGDAQEVIRVSRARFEQLMNLVGELVIGHGRLEQRLVALEQLSKQVVARKSRLVDAVQLFAGKHPITFRDAPSAQATPSPHRSDGSDDFSGVDIRASDDFDILAQRIGEVSADITESMAQLSGSLQYAHDDMKQLQHVTRNMRDEIARTRMIPIGTPFTRFRRAIRDIARASNKEVALVTSGEHTQVDTGVVERLVEPLVHLVRNAIYHGIELPADRIAKGKPAAGTIYLHAAHRGNSIIVEVEDDGAGLNLEKIREKAVDVGLAQAEQVCQMTDAEARQFIFAPGFSTADTIGGQAGRGMGLDVVKKVVEGMNGHIEVESLSDVGTKFTLDLPLTLLITTALFVRAGTERYAIALSNIREVTPATSASVTKTEDRTLFSLGKEMIEVQSLRHLLRGEPAEIDSLMPMVIVRTATGVKGLAVDELLGLHEIVIKRLGSLEPLERSCFGGATIDHQGRVILVIDPSRLGGWPAGQPRRP
jgi:chemosensory pili system protein ChpA (sensor histidine kinase/response regulator)